MKTRTTLLILCFAINFHLFAQNSACDKVFNTYSEKQGFATLNFSGNILKGIFANGNTDSDFNITSVKILLVEDSLLNQNLNFFKEILPNLNKKDYEELMTIKNSKNDFVILCKKEHQKITELIMISGGADNSLIYVKGSLSLSEAHEISQKLSEEDNF
jgi:hypothetical protein